MKTKQGLMKRIKILGSGKIKHWRMNLRHGMLKRPNNNKKPSSILNSVSTKFMRKCI